MSARWIIAAVIIAAAGLAPYAGSQPDAQQQQLPGSRVDPDPSQNLLQEGLVEARGPVHEAFAQPVTRQPEPAPVVPKQPPQAIEELPPETKPEGDHIIWAPGYWAWDDDRQDYLWVSGIWRAVPPERIWIAGHWHEVDGCWLRVAGY